MNDKIKQILEKHRFNVDEMLTGYETEILNDAIVEICQEQIRQTIE